jgi:uncharacterized membrane protein
MDVDLITILVSVVFSSLGVGYLIYGKKSENYIFIFDGMLLMAYPYFCLNNSILMLFIGLVLAILPHMAIRMGF